MAICLSGLEAYTEKTLDKATWGYYHNEVTGELTRRGNFEVFNQYM